MVKRLFRAAAVALGGSLLLCMQSPQSGFPENCLRQVQAAEGPLSQVLVLDTDLIGQQKPTVLTNLGVTQEQLENYTVLTEKEHASGLGIKLVQGEKGSGVSLNTYNLEVSIAGAYSNALTTLGVTDVQVSIAAPYPVSGAEGLYGIAEGYAALTGVQIPDTMVDAAYEELTQTSALEEDPEAGKLVVDLMEALKNSLASGSLKTDDDIRSSITQQADQLGITLSEKQVKSILNVMHTLQKIGWGIGSIAQEGESIYAESGAAALDHPDQAVSSYVTKKISKFFTDLFHSLGQGITDLFRHKTEQSIAA